MMPNGEIKQGQTLVLASQSILALHRQSQVVFRFLEGTTLQATIPEVN